MCNDCEFYSEIGISNLDSNNVETYLKEKLIMCQSMKKWQIQNNLYLRDKKSDKSCVIGIKKANDQKMLTPDWCPLIAGFPKIKKK